MPDGIGLFGKNIPREELDDFHEWLRNEFGFQVFLQRAFTPGGLSIDDPLYQRWINEGKPTGREPTLVETQAGLREQFAGVRVIPDEGLTEEQRVELRNLGWTTQVGTLGGITWIPPQVPEEPELEFPLAGVMGGEVITLNGQQFLKTTLPDGSFDYRPLGLAPTEPEVEQVGETIEQRQLRNEQFQRFLTEMELAFAGDPSKFIQLHFLRQIPKFLQFQKQQERFQRRAARQEERGEELIARAGEALIPTQAVTTTRPALVKPEVTTTPGAMMPSKPEVGGVAIAERQVEEERKALAKRAPRKPSLVPPPLPAGLAPFIPGAAPGVEITQALAQRQIPVPSPQQFMATSPTTRAQLRGFLEFGGQSYADILAEMERRLLTAPAGGRGKPTVARQR